MYTNTMPIIKKFSLRIIYCFILALFLMATLSDSARSDTPPEITPESQLYDMQYFSISVPKGWVSQEVYGHQDIQPGQDGFIVFCNNMGEHIDIFSVSFYDPQYPQYNIVVSVKNKIEIFKINNDKGINTALLQRYYEQHDFTNFSSHEGSTSIGALSGYESSLNVSNEKGPYLTYDGKRVDADNYIYLIEHYVYNNFSEGTKARLDEVINSFKLKSQSLSVADISVNTAEDHYNRGVDYYDQGNSTLAMFDLDQALEMNPKFVGGYFFRGFLYGEDGNFVQAMSDFNKALEIDPNYAAVYVARGCAYFTQGNYTQAMSDFNKALEIDPNLVKAYSNRGLTYFMQGNYTQAMTDLNKALEINPNDAGSYYNRALVFLSLKEYDGAWSDVHKAEALGKTVDPRIISALQKVSGRDQ